MTPLSSMYGEYRLSVRGHTPIIALSEDDYFTLFKQGVRRMFIDTGRATLFKSSSVSTSADSLSVDLSEAEQEYIILAARIAFFRQMLADATGGDHVTQHKTDALTVVFSDKTAANISQMIADLELRLTDLFHKMPQFAEAKAEE